MKYGFFDESKKEYVITRPDTPAPTTITFSINLFY